jgi:hypothetical protein
LKAGWEGAATDGADFKSLVFRHPDEGRDPGACGKLLIMWPLDSGIPPE